MDFIVFLCLFSFSLSLWMTFLFSLQPPPMKRDGLNNLNLFWILTRWHRFLKKGRISKVSNDFLVDVDLWTSHLLLQNLYNKLSFLHAWPKNTTGTSDPPPLFKKHFWNASSKKELPDNELVKFNTDRDIKTRNKLGKAAPTNSRPIGHFANWQPRHPYIAISYLGKYIYLFFPCHFFLM